MTPVRRRWQKTAGGETSFVGNMSPVNLVGKRTDTVFLGPRALALALVVWFVAVVLVGLAALGVASLLPSGTASRVLILATLLNPLGAVRTGTLLGIEGTGAFGAASLALLRFTRGAWGAGLLLSLSLLFWLVAPTALADRRLRRADI
jgi:Cu-processing system permease protein